VLFPTAKDYKKYFKVIVSSYGGTNKFSEGLPSSLDEWINCLPVLVQIGLLIARICEFLACIILK
jgi:hypothetical protein